MKIATFFDHIKQASDQTGRPLEEMLEFAVSCGITGLDISYADLLRYRGFLMDFCEKHNTAVSCVYETFDFPRDTDTAKGHALIDHSSACGVRNLLIIPGFIDPDTADRLHRSHGSKEDTFSCMDSMPSVQNIRAALSDLTAYAADKNIAVTLEDYDNDIAPFSRIYQLLYFMEKVPNLKFTFDMGNFAYADEDVTSALQLLAPYIAHAHCKDRGVQESAKNVPCGHFTYCRGLAPAAVGSGYLPIAALVKQLKETGYDGYYVIEHFDAPDQAEYLKRSAAFLRDILD